MSRRCVRVIRGLHDIVTRPAEFTHATTANSQIGISAFRRKAAQECSLAFQCHDQPPTASIPALKERRRPVASSQIPRLVTYQGNKSVTQALRSTISFRICSHLTTEFVVNALSNPYGVRTCTTLNPPNEISFTHNDSRREISAADRPPA